MKRIYPVIIAILLCSATTFSQVRYGIQGSLQATTIASTVDLSSLLGPSVSTLTLPITQRVGFRAGIMADFSLTNQLSVRPQLYYSVKGGDIDVGAFVSTVLSKVGLPTTSFPVETSISKVVINYIELPVMLMYGFGVGPGRLVVGAGPYAAVAVSGTINGEPITFSTTGFRKHDLGATASLGYELPIGLTISAYYAHGLTNFSRNATPNLAAFNPANPTASLDPSAFGGTLRNRSYGLAVGYFLKAHR